MAYVDYLDEEEAFEEMLQSNYFLFNSLPEEDQKAIIDRSPTLSGYKGKISPSTKYFYIQLAFKNCPPTLENMNRITKSFLYQTYKKLERLPKLEKLNALKDL